MAVKKNTKPTQTATTTNKNTSRLQPTAKSERVVVDEIFDDGTVRLLRAKKTRKSAAVDLSIGAWNSEREYFIKAWQVEAFVGFPSTKHLREGDVFLIADGSQLTNKYGTKLDPRHKKPLPREVASKMHLIHSADKSKENARTEIKKEFYKLSAVKMTADKKELDEIIKTVEEKFKNQNPIQSKKGER